MNSSSPVSQPIETAAPAEVRPPKPRRRVLMNAAFSIFTRLQGALFTYATTYMLLHALAVEEYGVYTVLFIGTINSLMLLGRLGLPSLLQRFIPEYFTQGRYRLIVRMFWASNLLQAAAAALLLLITFALSSQIAGWMKIPHMESVLRVFAVGAFSYLMAENFRTLLGALFMHDTIFWRNLVYNIVRLGAIFYATRMPDPLTAVVVAEAAMYGFSYVLFFIHYRRKVVPRVAADPHPPERPPWKRFTRYTALSYANEAGVMLLNSATDLFLVSGFIGGTAAGLYGLANRITALVHYVLPSNFLSAVITPLFFSEYGASRERARFGFTLLTKISLLITIPMAVWLSLMARPMIVQLFDPRYADAAQILFVMGMFLPMETMRYPLALILQNAERNDLLIYSKIFGVIKIGVGLYLLSHGAGMTVMVWITCLAIAGQNLLSYYWVVRVLKSPTDHVGLLRLVINGAVSAAILLLLRPYLGGLVGVIASVPLYAAIWLGLNMLHRTFRPEERDFLNEKLRRQVWKF